MSEHQHYPRSPITEALIDIRVELPDGVDVSQLAQVHESIQNAYPTKTRLNLSTGELELGARLSAAASTEHKGFLFKSADEKQIVQVRYDGFTLSRLAPYQNWESFRDEARRLWDVYRSVAKPAKVTRLAVRYINRLDIPGQFIELKDYLATFPEVAPGIPQGLAGFLMQLNIPVQDLGATLLVNEMLLQPNRPDVVSVLLDIDIFREADLPSDDDGVWACFERLRVRKNEIFNACITQNTRRLID